MIPCCDLHTHSIYSDGTYTPARLVEEAEKLGLSAIALTDHNTVSGIPEFLAAASGTSVEAVAGIEFSTDYLGMDLHILGLCLPEESFPRITELMQEGIRAKEQSNLDLVEGLARAGFPLDYRAIREATPNGQVNRALLGAAMTEKGYTDSIRDAFHRFLEPECGFYHPPKRPSSFEIIRFIKSIGAVAVMAHPLLKLNREQLWEFLRKACPWGLDGMETRYSTFDEETTRFAVATAEEFGILQSGGSDFHGANKPDIRLKTGRGNLEVPLEFLNLLKQRRG